MIYVALSLGDLTKISLGVVSDKKLKQEYTEIARDGIYYTYDNGAMVVTELQHSIPEGVLKGVLTPTIEEKFELHEKVPFSIFLQIVQFYHDVTREHHTEACVLIYKNVHGVTIPQEFKDSYGQAILEVGDFVVVVPNQVNSGSQTKFAGFNGVVDESVHTWCESNLVGVAETHSHNDFSPFWSGKDDKNEKHTKLRMFMVMGYNTKDVATEVRYSYNYNYYEGLDVVDLFNEPDVYEETTTTINLVSKGLERFINFFKPKKVVEKRELTWKEVINSLDLDNNPVEYPKEAWFARIQRGQQYRTVDFELEEELEMLGINSDPDYSGGYQNDLADEDEDLLDGDDEDELLAYRAKYDYTDDEGRAINKTAENSFRNFYKKGKNNRK